MKKLIILLSIVSLLGCKNRCKAPEEFADRLTPKVAFTFGCSNKEQIKKDLTRAINKWGICEKEMQSGLLCQSMAKVVSYYVVEKSLPKDWNCNGGVAKDVLEGILTAACSMVIPLNDKN